MRRYERASTMLTSNRPVEDWGKIAGRRGCRERHARPLARAKALGPADDQHEGSAVKAER
jgi:hypothetical protein